MKKSGWLIQRKLLASLVLGIFVISTLHLESAFSNPLTKTSNPLSEAPSVAPDESQKREQDAQDNVDAMNNLLAVNTAALGEAEETRPYTDSKISDVPDFAKDHTAINTRSGKWTDASIWEGGKVPEAGAVVMIAKGTRIEYDLAEMDQAIHTIGIKGELAFANHIDTQLKVGNLLVYKEGTLTIDSTDPAIKTEIVIADQALNKDFDPKEFGTGIVVDGGALHILGAKKNQTFIRTAQEPQAGDSVIALEEDPIGWRVGDAVVLSDTRQIKTGPSQTETAIITSISGTSITLDRNLQYSHRGAHDEKGNVLVFPHVAVISRNVVIRSERAGGPDVTRGHVYASGSSDINIQYTELKDLGRERALGWSTEKQFDRQALFLDRLNGRQNLTNTGFQYQLVGNSIVQPSNYGIKLTETHYGRVQQNVVWGGATGYATTTGNETGNSILDNITIQQHGVEDERLTNRRDSSRWRAQHGLSGFGFMLAGMNNNISGNVASDVLMAGFKNRHPDQLDVPRYAAYRGARIDQEGQYGTINYRNGIPLDLRLSKFENNEAYASDRFGFESWGNDAASHYKDVTLWNIRYQGVYLYGHGADRVFDGFKIYGDFDLLKAGQGMSVGFYLDSRVSGTFVNAEVLGTRVGAQMGRSHPRATLWKDSHFQNITNIQEVYYRHGRAPITIDGVTFDSIEGFEPDYIRLDFDTTHGSITADSSRIKVLNYNGTGENFDLVYKAQAADAMVRYHQDDSIYAGTTNHRYGCPEQNLTNAQCYTKYGVATGGIPTYSTEERVGLTGAYVEQFRTDYEPPRISNVRILETTDDSITIAWTTDEPSDSQIILGITNENSIQAAIFDPNNPVYAELTTEHVVTITGLTRGVSYRAMLKSKDAAGNAGYYGSYKPPVVTTSPVPVVSRFNPPDAVVAAPPARRFTPTPSTPSVITPFTPTPAVTRPAPLSSNRSRATSSSSSLSDSGSEKSFLAKVQPVVYKIVPMVTKSFEQFELRGFTPFIIIISNLGNFRQDTSPMLNVKRRHRIPLRDVKTGPLVIEPHTVQRTGNAIPQPVIKRPTSTVQKLVENIESIVNVDFLIVKLIYEGLADAQNKVHQKFLISLRKYYKAAAMAIASVAAQLGKDVPPAPEFQKDQVTEEDLLWMTQVQEVIDYLGIQAHNLKHPHGLRSAIGLALVEQTRLYGLHVPSQKDWYKQNLKESLVRFFIEFREEIENKGPAVHIKRDQEATDVIINLPPRIS